MALSLFFCIFLKKQTIQPILPPFTANIGKSEEIQQTMIAVSGSVHASSIGLLLGKALPKYVLFRNV
ncbi:hypothetical protein CN327_25490 [Bacillus cereus]|nr:hypothetical protein CN327_25490 [Bacillus cereus]